MSEYSIFLYISPQLTDSNNLQHKTQMDLISLLSGCIFDEELLVQPADVRALAIYKMFPSLRETVCFVENTSDAVIRSLQEDHL